MYCKPTGPGCAPVGVRPLRTCIPHLIPLTPGITPMSVKSLSSLVQGTGSAKLASMTYGDNAWSYELEGLQNERSTYSAVIIRWSIGANEPVKQVFTSVLQFRTEDQMAFTGGGNRVAALQNAATYAVLGAKTGALIILPYRDSGYGDVHVPMLVTGALTDDVTTISSATGINVIFTGPPANNTEVNIEFVGGEGIFANALKALCQHAMQTASPVDMGEQPFIAAPPRPPERVYAVPVEKNPDMQQRKRLTKRDAFAYAIATR